MRSLPSAWRTLPSSTVATPNLRPTSRTATGKFRKANADARAATFNRVTRASVLLSSSVVGVEYVVPFTAWTSPTPPTLYGESFQRNETFQVWALHAWIWKENPRGTFASWNPSVSCTTGQG